MSAAHTRWWQIFEVVFGIPALAATVLQWAVPLAFPAGPLTPMLLPAGVALLIIGVALVILARRELSRRGQPTDPGRPTSALVVTGVFAVSRNPLYLGGVCVLVGAALLLNLPWAIILMIPALVACHALLIIPEERYLAETFGEGYRAYAARVHRWAGRRRPGR